MSAFDAYIALFGCKNGIIESYCTIKHCQPVMPFSFKKPLQQLPLIFSESNQEFPFMTPMSKMPNLLKNVMPFALARFYIDDFALKKALTAPK